MNRLSYFLILLLTICMTFLSCQKHSFRYLDGREGDKLGFEVFGPTEFRLINFSDDAPFRLIVKNPNHYPITFPKTVEWPDGAVPQMRFGSYAAYYFFHTNGERYIAWAQTSLCGEIPNLYECLPSPTPTPNVPSSIR